MEKKYSIKSWAIDDRPRERLLLKGKFSLSDAELSLKRFDDIDAAGADNNE